MLFSVKLVSKVYLSNFLPESIEAIMREELFCKLEGKLAFTSALVFSPILFISGKWSCYLPEAGDACTLSKSFESLSSFSSINTDLLFEIL